MRDAGKFLTVSLILFAGLSAGAGDPLEARVEAVLKTPAYAAGHWGLLVVDAKTGAVVYEKNADRMFCPASVTKLFSTAAALVDLGADHRFKTPVVRRGEVDEDGTLHGRPDPRRPGRPDASAAGPGRTGSLLFEDNDHTYAGRQPRRHARRGRPARRARPPGREVHAAGIKAITGDVLVDDRLFEHAAEHRQRPDAGRRRSWSTTTSSTSWSRPRRRPASRPRSGSSRRPRSSRSTPRSRPAAEAAKPSVEVVAVGPRRFTVRGRSAGRPRAGGEGLRGRGARGRSPGRCSSRPSATRASRSAASPLGDNPATKLPTARRGRDAAAGGRIHLAAVPRVPQGDPQGQPQPARQHPAAAGRRAPRRDDAGRRAAARGGDPQGAGRRPRGDLVRRRRRRLAGRPGHAEGDRRAPPGDGRAARLPRVRGRPAGPRPRRHAGQGRRRRQPRPGPRPGQDRHLLGRQRPERRGDPHEQGPGRLHGDRLGPAAGLRLLPQQRADRAATTSPRPPPPPAALLGKLCEVFYADGATPDAKARWTPGNDRGRAEGRSQSHRVSWRDPIAGILRDP